MAEPMGSSTVRVVNTEDDIETERRAFLETLLPAWPDLRPENFQIGLGANDEQFEQVEGFINIAFENSNLAFFPSLADPEADEVFNNTLIDVFKYLSELFPEVQQWFISIWVKSLFEHLWDQGKSIVPPTESEGPAAADGSEGATLLPLTFSATRDAGTSPPAFQNNLEHM